MRTRITDQFKSSFIRVSAIIHYLSGCHYPLSPLTDMSRDTTRGDAVTDRGDKAFGESPIFDWSLIFFGISRFFPQCWFFMGWISRFLGSEFPWFIEGGDGGRMKILQPIQYFALCRILLCGHAYNTVDGSSWLSFVIALSSASCGGADGGACEVGMGTGSFGWLEGGGGLWGQALCFRLGCQPPTIPSPLSLLLQPVPFIAKRTQRGQKIHACRLKGQFSSVTHRMISIKYDILKQFSWNVLFPCIAVSLTTWLVVCFFCVCVCLSDVWSNAAHHRITWWSVNYAESQSLS